MIAVYVYFGCLLLCGAWALVAGGAPERLAILIMVVGSIASRVLAEDATAYSNVEWGIFAVDVMDQALFTVLALKADRFWPIPVASLHMLPIMAHSAKAIAPTIEKLEYGLTQGLESWIILALIAAGVVRHRQRVKRLGTDRSWSTF